MHPAIMLLGITQCLLAFLIPLMLGLLTYRTETRARLWFAAGVLYSIYLFLIFIFPGKDFSAFRALQIALLWLYIAALIYFLVRESGRRIGVFWIPVAAALTTAVQSYLSSQGALLAEQTMQSLFVVGSDTLIGFLALLLGLKGRVGTAVEN